MRASRSSYAMIYDVVDRIPRGRVATYGQIASLAGLPGHARQVGYALHATPDEREIPWHRVINARGEVSRRSEPQFESIQEQLLQAEGITFTPAGRIDLKRYQWQPR
jgi:methylated-DNA-protein-cysteine methyltransferase-like protein